MPFEWLIDLIKEWVIDQAYATEAWVQTQLDTLADLLKAEITDMRDYLLGVINALECFVDRGDPAAHDWTEATLTLPTGWRDLDLSAIVPADAKAVLFLVWTKDVAINRDFYLRKKGNVNAINMCTIRTQVANIWIMNDIVCACDVNRFVQYWSTISASGSVRLTVRGWWF